MKQTVRKTIPLLDHIIQADAVKVGDDIHILVKGGERPHIGCTVISVPRPSLKGGGKISCTSSVINVAGHKDEAICRMLAEKIAVRENTVTVCTGGFHVDGMTESQIREVLKTVEEIADEIEMHEFSGPLNQEEKKRNDNGGVYDRSDEEK